MISTNYTPNNRSRIIRKSIGIASASLMLAFPFFIMHTNPAVEHSQSLCPYKLLTGMPCPGCGITKSVLFFYEGDIYKSFSYHLLGPLAVAASVLMIILFSAEIITRKDYYNSFFSSKKLAYALGILLVGYHLVRTGYFIATHSFSDILHESIWM